MKKQKFTRGTRVHVCKEMPTYMSHFKKDFIGIVQYTYSQEYGGDDIDNYSIVVLDKDGIPCNTIAWYEEYQLTEVHGYSIQEGLSIIEEYLYPKLR